MSWRQELDAILPPDRADAAPITTHLRGLLEALHNGQGDRPRITITLEQDAWSMLESQFRRPYRPHSSYMLVPLDVGAVAFERRKDAPASGPTPEQSAEGFVEVKCRHCGVTTFGHRLTYCVACGKGYDAYPHHFVPVTDGRQVGLNCVTCGGRAEASWHTMPTTADLEKRAPGYPVPCDARPAPDAGGWWKCPQPAGHFPATPHTDAGGKPWPEQPRTTAPSDASWPEGPFPRPADLLLPRTMMADHVLVPDPVVQGGFIPKPLADELRGKWDAAAIEAKAASLSTPTDGTRPEGAIYSAPMAEPMVEGGKVVDVAVYGGPWKESK